MFDESKFLHNNSNKTSRQSIAVRVGALLLFAAVQCSHAAIGNPEKVRELSADRPDATESPISVDKGFFQIEASFISFTRNSAGGTTTESLGIAESNVKYGLLDNVDLQLVFTPYQIDSTETGGAKTTVEDFSDLTVRLKCNIWGNDGGKTALGFIPTVKIPTHTEVSNGEWEGGAILPFSWDVGENWGIGMQAEVNRVYDEDAGGMDWEFAHTAVVGIDLTKKFGIYLEYLGIAGDHAYQPHFSNGVTYSVNERTTLDAGSVIGITEAADDLTLFTGISFKF